MEEKKNKKNTTSASAKKSTTTKKTSTTKAKTKSAKAAASSNKSTKVVKDTKKSTNTTKKTSTKSNKIAKKESSTSKKNVTKKVEVPKVVEEVKDEKMTVETIKNTTLGFLMFGIIIGVFLICQLVSYIMYDIKDYNKNRNGVKIINTINVQNEVNRDDIRYYDFNYIRFDSSLLDGFEEKSENSEENFISFNRVTSDNKTAVLSIGVLDSSMVENFRKYDKKVNYIDGKVSFDITKEYMRGYFSKYNITTDMDLIKHVVDDNLGKVRFFSSSNTMKEAFVENHILNFTFGTGGDLVVLTGDLDGYLFTPKDNSAYQILYVNKQNKTFYISMVNCDKIFDGYAEDLIDSLIIR